jgi:MFS family permease
MKRQAVRQWLSTAHPFWFSLYAALAAFCLYTCVYAFRKTFAVATFDGMMLAGVSYKVWLVTAQVAGYATSKFIGIKIVSELPPQKRFAGIALMVAAAGLSWLLFALAPTPYNIVFLFTNGLPLGMVWGLVFSYLEGRRTTEVLGAALSVSFIFSAGLCRSVGSFVMQYWGVTEFWMPFVASCLFALPLVAFLFLLDMVPPPDAEDERLRTKRQPMMGAERAAFVKTFLPGIVLFTLCYLLLTVYRDFRDNFSAEVWTALGYGKSPAIYSATEIPVTVIVLLIIGSLIVVRNNRLALILNHVIIATGLALIGVSTYLYQLGALSPVTWMILVGIGLYMGYVPFNSIFFDRMLAAFQYVGTVGFIMYVADSVGYLGSVSVLLVKEFSGLQLSWLDFYIQTGYWVSAGGFVLIAGSMLYFLRKMSGGGRSIT